MASWLRSTTAQRLATGVAASTAALVALQPPVAHCAAPDKDKYFDPEALERGAAALREINKSPYAKQVLDITKQQELTKQQEAKKAEAEFKASAERAAIEREHIHAEEQRKTLQQQAQHRAEVAQYEDGLARKRSEAEHEKQRQRNAELVVLQEESNKRQLAERRVVEESIQAERRATEKYKAELEKEVQRERALAEAEGRTLERRKNEDIYRRELQMELQERRKRWLAAIDAVFTNVGQGASALLDDRTKLLTTVGGVTLLAGGVYGMREAARAGGKAFEQWFGTPRLVRETSRRKPWELFKKGPAGAGSAGSKTIEEVKRDFSDIVLPGGLQDTVRAMAAVTSNTRRHAAPFRHMLFYGPPGTGKTMAAKRLARTSGLDYAIMSGGDVAPLGGKAVTQLHEMFNWAERSRRGLLLFIDEADAFLGKRGEGMSEGMRGALNALLFRTGDQSRDFAVVLATNRPGDLDAAVLDRMDEALEFPLPGEGERLDILRLYLDKYIAKAGTAEGGAGSGGGVSFFGRIGAMLRGRRADADRIKIQGVDDALLQDVARRTEGFSGRELAKLMASAQAAAYGSVDGVLTAEMFTRVVDTKLREHQQRRAFEQGLHTSGK